MSDNKKQKLDEVRTLMKILESFISDSIPENDNDPILQKTAEQLIKAAIEYHIKMMGE